MKGQNTFILCTLYCTYLWWCCVCDIPTASHSKADTGPNSNPSDLNVQQLHEDNSNDIRSSMSDTTHKKQPVQNSNVVVPNFNETVRKMRRKDDIEKTKIQITRVENLVESSNIASKLNGEKVVNFHREKDNANLNDQNSKTPAESQLKPIEKKIVPSAEDDNLNVDSTPSRSDKLSGESPEQGQHPHSEAMPSFDEWKKMMLAEQEKDGQLPAPGPPGKKLSNQKRRRNYASYECGAKIVSVNPEAEGTSRILNELVDEYMLNPCQAKIWFVIEMCESVQTSQIELGNFELFSSCPKEFSVYSSDNFPTRDWVLLGSFTAADQRVLQSFQLKQEGFGKFIKVEFSGHYGKEHYCPLSVVHLFGTSMVDEYEEMETQSDHSPLHDDELDRLDLPVEDKGSSNIFGTATDAVITMVKKAAQAFSPTHTTEGTDIQELNLSESCKLPNANCNKTSKLAKLHEPEFLISVGSIHRTLFHHLKKCEQCVKESRPSYHSTSEPQCRFFQAALGPVLFTTICEWFRDHHLATLHQIPAVDSDNSSNASLKPTSPPPSVIQVIVDANQTDSSLPSLPDSNLNVPKSVDLVDETKVLSSMKLVLGSTILSNVDATIKPSRTVLDIDNLLHTDSSVGSKLDLDSFHHEDILQGTEDTKASPIDSNEISSSATLMPSGGIVTNVTDAAAEEDIKEPSYESLEDVTSVPSSIDAEEYSDIKDPTIKIDTVAIGVSGSSQKESVFVRMNNRIKALELNMSLSSQYLQELSQRYRRQMEDMQRAFNRTIGTLNDTTKKAAEKDLKQQEAINSLKEQVENLTLVVHDIISQRSSLTQKVWEMHLFLMAIEVIVMCTIMSICVHNNSSRQSLPSPEPILASHSSRKRPNSADSRSVSTVAKVKKRTSSEEMLDELLIIEPIKPPPPKARRRNRKKKGMQRSLSNPSMSPSKTVSSPDKKKTKEQESAAGIIFSHAHDGKTNTSYTCENCNRTSDAKCFDNDYVHVNNADKKRNKCNVPFKNLTNGDFDSHSNADSLDEYNFPKGKDKFSFRKFLRMQKRESI